MTPKLDQILGRLAAYQTEANSIRVRFEQWAMKHGELMQQLAALQRAIAAQHPYFAGTLAVESYHENFTDDAGRKWEASYLKGVALYLKDVPVVQYTHDETQERQVFYERGFALHFKPLLNGRIEVFCVGHSRRTDAPPFSKLLYIYDYPHELTPEVVEEQVLRMLELVHKTSFLFEDIEEPVTAAPVGFKRV